MKYIEFINNLIKQEVSGAENLVLFGQSRTRACTCFVSGDKHQPVCS